MRRGASAVLTATVAAALTIGGAQARAQAPVPALVKGKCPVKLAKGVQRGPDVVCGTVRVPLDHAKPGGRSIRLAVAVVRSKAARVKPEPIVFLAGGPGEKVLGSLGGVKGGPQGFTGVRDRDLVLFDQRGVGFSRPALECPELGAVTDLTAAPAATVACRTRLEKRTDLSRFTTAQNAEDVDLVRRALGYERVNLLANSYGTDLALAVLRDDPLWVRSALLSSPAPPQSNFVADAGPSYQRALDALLRACRRDAECNGAHPDLSAKLDGLITRLAAQPASVSVPDPKTGQPVAVPITAGLVSTVLYQFFYAPTGPAALPAVIEELAAGRYELLLEGNPSQPTGSPISFGMQLSVMCAELIPRTSRKQVAARAQRLGPAAQAFIGLNPIIGIGVFDLCKAIDVPARPAAARAVRSSRPSLVVTGEFDQITPPSYGRQALRGLSRGELIAARGVGHSPVFALGSCGERIMRAFFGAPTRAPATKCAQRPITFLEPKATAARSRLTVPPGPFAYFPR